MSQRVPGSGDVALPLYAEDVTVDRRKVEQGTVRVSVQTNARERLVNEEVMHTRVEVKRIPIGRIVQAAPPMRTEGDTIIIPVMEETIVVERRLVLKEEIILQRVHTTEPYRENITLREQEAVIERTDVNGLSLPNTNPDKPFTD
jgi:uncharacterized protein (TIGR02271 family)